MSPPSVHLPVELIEEILSVSPAKSVLRFKSVSKQWHAIISDPRFSRIHRIRRSKLSKNQNMFIVRRSRKEPGEIRSLGLMRLEDGKLRKVSELDHQPVVTDYHRYYTPLCSCNGAFLLTIDHSDYMLWNPSIRKSSMISAPTSNRCYLYDLYHDETSDDYKIVFVYDNNKYTVYSCQNRSWGEMLDMHMPCDHKSLICYYRGAIVDGCFYVPRNVEEIVFLDVRDGKLDRFPQPNYDHDHDHVEEKGGLFDQVVHLKAISGRLCLSSYTYKYNTSGSGKQRFELWVMERNENLEHCWRKLMCSDIGKHTRLFRPMWLSNEDNLVIGRFDNESKLSISNCVEKGFQEIEFDRNTVNVTHFFQYQENLSCIG